MQFRTKSTQELEFMRDQAQDKKRQLQSDMDRLKALTEQLEAELERRKKETP